jgi:sulfhydrogenase subunit gamma (sulfur reductase)
MSATCQCEANRQLYVPKLAVLEKIVPQTELETLFEFRFEDGQPLGHRAGQFVEMSLPGIGEAPISIASAPCEDPIFELCVRKVGNVTAALHHLKEGALVGIRGPFGNGFPDDALKGQDVLVVAGGIGLVPVRPLIHHIMCNRLDYGNFTILYGMKRPEDMLFADEIETWQASDAVDLRLTIDRPHPDWAGHVGVITTLFPDLELEAPRTRAVVVGPPIMYRFVILECKNKAIADEHIILSLERHMKCGVGKCGHCQINNKYVCLDGPVFTYSELKHMWEAI